MKLIKNIFYLSVLLSVSFANSGAFKRFVNKPVVQSSIKFARGGVAGVSGVISALNLGGVLASTMDTSYDYVEGNKEHAKKSCKSALKYGAISLVSGVIAFKTGKIFFR